MCVAVQEAHDQLLKYFNTIKLEQNAKNKKTAVKAETPTKKIKTDPSNDSIVMTPPPPINFTVKISLEKVLTGSVETVLIKRIFDFPDSSTSKFEKTVSDILL